MGNKYYLNKTSFENFKNFTVTKDKSDFYNTEVEIKIIDPVYEYQVIFKYRGKSQFETSSCYYLDIDDFYNRGVCKEYISQCELYLPSRRERKQ